MCEHAKIAELKGIYLCPLAGSVRSARRDLHFGHSYQRLLGSFLLSPTRIARTYEGFRSK